MAIRKKSILKKGGANNASCSPDAYKKNHIYHIFTTTNAVPLKFVSNERYEYIPLIPYAEDASSNTKNKAVNTLNVELIKIFKGCKNNNVYIYCSSRETPIGKSGRVCTKFFLYGKPFDLFDECDNYTRNT